MQSSGLTAMLAGFEKFDIWCLDIDKKWKFKKKNLKNFLKSVKSNTDFPYNQDVHGRQTVCRHAVWTCLRFASYIRGSTAWLRQSILRSRDARSTTHAPGPTPLRVHTTPLHTSSIALP